MRKFSVSLLAISFFIFSLFGCEDVSKKEPVVYFSSDAQIKTQDIELTAKISSTLGQNITVSVLSPDALKGMSYQIVNSTLYIEYNGLKCTTNSDYLPSYAPVDVILDTMLSLQRNNFEYVKSDGKEDVYKGSGDNGEYTIFADKKSGYISKVEPHYTNCTITLSGVQPQ